MSVNNPIDKFLKEVFNEPELVKEFFTYLVPEDFLKNIEIEKLNKKDTEILNAFKKDRHLDFIQKFKYKDKKEEGYILIHIEFQSSNDNRMPIRFLNYMSSWYENNHKNLGVNEKIKPIIPILLYVGYEDWTAKKSFHELFDIPHDSLEPYIPNFKYIPVLINEDNINRLINTNSMITKLLALFKMENKEDLNKVFKSISDFGKSLNDESKFHRYFDLLIFYITNILKIPVSEKEYEEFWDNTREGGNMFTTLLEKQLAKDREIDREKDKAEIIAQERRNIVIEMIKDMELIDKIVKYTKLSKEQIKKIAKEEKLTNYLSK